MALKEINKLALTMEKGNCLSSFHFFLVNVNCFISLRMSVAKTASWLLIQYVGTTNFYQNEMPSMIQSPDVDVLRPKTGVLVL